MVKLEHLHKVCTYIEKTSWLSDFDFWLLGSVPKIVAGEKIRTDDIDIAVVNKFDCHNKIIISDILSSCIDLIHDVKLDIYYRPKLNVDLDNKGLSTIWTDIEFWNETTFWPTKENYHAWRVKHFRPIELWYYKNKKLEVEYKVWPNAKHIERVIDGHKYAKPILLNTYIKEEKHHDMSK